MGARKQLNQILIQNFYVYYEKLKRPEINEERVYQKPKIVGRLSGSNSPPLIWCSWWEMLFPFLFFIRFPFCGSPHALSSCHLCRHLRTTLRSFRSFLIFTIIWLFLWNCMFEKLIVLISKHLFDTFIKNSKIILIPLLLS